MRILTVFLLSLVSTVALAATVTLTWIPPATGTKGEPLTGVNAIASNRIDYGSCAGNIFGTKAGEFNAGPVTTYVTSDLGAGTYCFRVFAKTAAGTESAASNVAVKVVAPPPVIPNPPSGLVATDTTVYEPRRIFFWQFAYAVGRTTLGTECLDNRFGSLNGLSPTKVTLTRKSVGGPYYARCA